MKQTSVVFLTLVCLYALTAGGQGYSVDGQFAYQMATSIATDPAREFARVNAGTLRRWGPALPALGLPFAWAGAQLAHFAPPRDSVVIGGDRLSLHDWPAIGAAGSDARAQLSVPAPSGIDGRVRSLRIVSYLSLSGALADGGSVAEMALVRAGGGEVARASLRAGQHTAEWAYDAPRAERPVHRRAEIAGRWPGNPNGNLYWSDVPLDDAGFSDVQEVLLRYVAPTGRLHVRAIELDVEGRRHALDGPIAWSTADQLAFFTRFAFSFVNAPLVALTCALLVPVARTLGYGIGPAMAIALGTGVATSLWPYAKHDFAEPAATLFMIAATLIVLRSPASGRVLLIAGAAASLAVSARYTAVVLFPLLALHLRSVRALVALAAIPTLGVAGVTLVTGLLPSIWSGVTTGSAQGWLDFSLWSGIYGLLLSPGKGLLWYTPALLLALAGLAPFVQRHRASAVVFIALPAAYLVTYAIKGVWHGGGWGPRYLVPVIPFLAMLALPTVDWLLREAPRAARLGAGILVVLSVGVQMLGVLKHPNLYLVMFRDHVLAGLPDYGSRLAGSAAQGYWQHFGGPEAGRQLSRPANGVDPSTPLRGLGYAFAEQGPLTLAFSAQEPFTLTLYACDWDHRGRRQRVHIQDARETRTIDLSHDFSDCEYFAAPIHHAGTVRLTVEATEARDVPVLSALFFDRAPPTPPAPGDGAWPGRVGRDGYVLFGWARGQDVMRLPAYVGAVSGGERVWVDTWQAELAETPILYAPGFSPLLAHTWLLGADAVALAAPGNDALLQRALASPPWRYLHGLDLHAPRPDFALGLDLWQLLVRSHFSSHTAVMVVTWVATALLAGGFVLGTATCLGEIRRPVIRRAAA
ncbi:MAG: hypothetical protein ACR2NO_11310 [Chloroflexota bacterium]